MPTKIPKTTTAEPLPLGVYVIADPGVCPSVWRDSRIEVVKSDATLTTWKHAGDGVGVNVIRTTNAWAWLTVPDADRVIMHVGCLLKADTGERTPGSTVQRYRRMIAGSKDQASVDKAALLLETQLAREAAIADDEAIGLYA